MPHLPARLPVLPVALVAFVGGCGHAATGAGSGHAATGGGAAPLDRGDERAAGRLMQLAEVPAAQIKLEDRHRLLRLARDQRCPCPGVAGSLEECAGEGAPCDRVRFVARSILRGLADGAADAEITAGLLERFGPREPERIDLEGAPCRGPENAPVVITVFSDFQCPHCSRARQLTSALEHEAKDRLRLCFKHYPLTSLHPQAELAARAAAAAQLQSRFWEMHDALFEHQDALEREDLLGHARELRLDEQRFAADLDSPEVRARVERDAAEAKRLRVRGTPSFYINGRPMTDPMTVPVFLDWIAEELALGRGK